MQLTQKRLISISGFAVFILFGYLAFQNFNSSQLDERVIPISQSGTNTVDNTGKTISGSTTALSGTWTDSPFGSGKPLTGEEKSLFKILNTEWKTRTLNINGKWLTYEYGKGNPIGVAMNLEQIDAMTKPCQNDMSFIEKGICDVEAGLMSYITPEVEKHLLAALSDPNWSKLAIECENHFRARETYLTPESIAQSVGNDPTYLTFDRVVSPGFLDIDRFISIEPTTGLKVLNNNLTISLAKFVMNGMYDGASRGEPQPNPYGDCVDRYGKDIARNLVTTTILYTRPLMDSKGIIHEVFTEYTIPFSFH